MFGLFAPTEAQRLRLPAPVGMADVSPSTFSLLFVDSRYCLTHQLQLTGSQGRPNCQTLCGIAAISSDNPLRPCWMTCQRRRSVRCSSRPSRRRAHAGRRASVRMAAPSNIRPSSVPVSWPRLGTLLVLPSARSVATQAPCCTRLKTQLGPDAATAGWIQDVRFLHEKVRDVEPLLAG